MRMQIIRKNSDGQIFIGMGIDSDEITNSK